MIQVTVAEYKYDALKLFEQVRLSGEVVQIRKHGRPIAQLIPIEEVSPPRILRQFRGDAMIAGDIVGPILDAHDWSEF